MKKYVLSAAAIVALGSTAPASAQRGGDIIQQGIQALLGGGGINSRLANLQNQIRVSFDRRQISRTEASRLQREVDQLRQLDRSFARNGLSQSERQELQQRLQRLERRLEQARLNRDDRFGRDNRFDDNRDGDSDEGDDEGRDEGDDEGDSDEGDDDEGGDEGDDDEGDDEGDDDSD